MKLVGGTATPRFETLLITQSEHSHLLDRISGKGMLLSLFFGKG